MLGFPPFFCMILKSAFNKKTYRNKTLIKSYIFISSVTYSLYF